MCQPEERTWRTCSYASGCPRINTRGRKEKIACRTVTHASQVWIIQDQDKSSHETRCGYHWTLRSSRLLLVGRDQRVEINSHDNLARISWRIPRTQHHHIVPATRSRACLREGQPRPLPSNFQTRSCTRSVCRTPRQYARVIVHGARLCVLVFTTRVSTAPLSSPRSTLIACATKELLPAALRLKNTNG